MQTGRQAVTALLAGAQSDFIPLHDSPWGDTMRLWTEQGMPTNGDGNPVAAWEHFGFDMVSCGGWFQWMARPEAQEVVEETDEWKTVRNGNGALLRWWKQRSGTPEHLDFQMTSRAVWENEYKPHLLDNFEARIGDTEAFRKNLERVRGQGRWAFFGHMFIWEYLRASLGDVNMFMALVEDPEWIRDFNRVYTDLYKACYEIIFEKAGLPDGIWIYEDLGYRDRLFCRPEILADLFFPFYKEVVDFFHDLGLPVVFHSCGYQEPMIPLAVEAGFDALNPMEVKAGNNIMKYAEEFGNQLCFVGGFDARVLESGDRKLIRQRVTEQITGLRERGARFLFGSDHSISSNVTYDSFQYALEVYRELRETK